MEIRITYAEAVSVSRAQNRDINEQGDVEVRESQQRTTDRMYVDKWDLVTFIAGVANCIAEVKSKNVKIQLIVKAAVSHLGLLGLMWEEVRENLTNQSSQEASWVGLYYL